MVDSEEYPLISAILLAGRTPLADIKRCIDCFHSQTYPRKELIIVNNAKNPIDIPDQDDIAIVEITSSIATGTARNQGIATANGQILAQFDADYWHAPSRLSAQVATMASEKTNICVLASVMQYSFISGGARISRNKQNAVLNTMVWARPAKIEYPDVSNGEEFGLLQKMLHSGMKPITIDKPELCCKLILTKFERQTKPHNYGLTEEQFEIILDILTVN